MSFVLHRTQKYAEQLQYADGDHIVKIEEVEATANENVFFVSFKFSDQSVLKNRYIYDPNKYNPFDALIDAALGYGVGDVKIQDLVGKHVQIEIRNEEKNGRRYTNIKRVLPAEKHDADVIAGDEEQLADEEDFNIEGDDGFDEDDF